ncbi:hypothetical protein GCM10020370_47840 [Paenibacillus hodogayensis]
MRSGTQDRSGVVVTTVYIAFEVSYKEGTLKKDDHEIADIRFWDMAEVDESDEIIELSKEIVLTSWKTRNGLYRGDQIKTNHSYRIYNFYVSNQ